MRNFTQTFVSDQAIKYFDKIKEELLIPEGIAKEHEQFADMALLGVIEQWSATDITKQLHEKVTKNLPGVFDIKDNVGKLFYDFSNIQLSVIQIHENEEVTQQEKEELYDRIVKFITQKSLKFSITPHPTSAHNKTLDDLLYNIHSAKSYEEQMEFITRLYTTPEIMERTPLTVEDEVDKLRLMCSKWFRVCPQVGQHIHQNMQELYEITGFEGFNISRNACQPTDMVSWIGSDTDGNYNVTAKSLDYCFQCLATDRNEDYYKYLDKLYKNSKNEEFRLIIKEISSKYMKAYDKFRKDPFAPSPSRELQNMLGRVLKECPEDILDNIGMQELENPDDEKFAGNQELKLSNRERIERLLYRINQCGDYGIRSDLRYNRADIENIFAELLNINRDYIAKTLGLSDEEIDPFDREFLNRFFFSLEENPGILLELDLEFDDKENSQRLFEHMRKAAQLKIVDKVIMAEVERVENMLQLQILCLIAGISREASLITLVESNTLYFGDADKDDGEEKISEEGRFSLDAVYENIFTYFYELLQQEAIISWNDSNEIITLWGHSDGRRQNGIAGGNEMLKEAKYAFLNAVKAYNMLEDIKVKIQDEISEYIELSKSFDLKADYIETEIMAVIHRNIEALRQYDKGGVIEASINKLLKSVKENPKGFLEFGPEHIQGVHFDGGGDSDARKTAGMPVAVSSGHFHATSNGVLPSLSDKVLFTVQGHHPLLKIFANYSTAVTQVEHIVASKVAAICSNYMPQVEGSKNTEIIREIFRNAGDGTIKSFHNIINSDAMRMFLDNLPAIAAGVKAGNVSSRATARVKQPGPIQLERYRAISTDAICRLMGMPRVTLLSAFIKISEIVEQCEECNISFEEFNQEEKEELYKYERLLAEIDFDLVRKFFPEKHECLAVIDEFQEFFENAAKELLRFMHGVEIENGDFSIDSQIILHKKGCFVNKLSTLPITQIGLGISSPDYLEFLIIHRDNCIEGVSLLGEINIQMIEEERYQFTKEEEAVLYPVVLKKLDEINNIPYISAIAVTISIAPNLFELFCKDYEPKMHTLRWHNEQEQDIFQNVI